MLMSHRAMAVVGVVVAAGLVAGGVGVEGLADVQAGVATSELAAQCAVWLTSLCS